MNEQQEQQLEVNQLDDYQQQLNDKAALDSIELSEKTIEPDDKVSGQYANRNYQLGNIGEHSLLINDMRANLAQDWLGIPEAKGGWLINRYGHLIMQKLDIYFIMSNSLHGMARKNEKTVHRNLTTQSGNKQKRTLFGTPKPRE